MTKVELQKLGYQDKFQFGSRVETPCGKKGIVWFNSESIDLCRVYYDKDGKTHPVMVKITGCRLLTLKEAVLI